MLGTTHSVALRALEAHVGAQKSRHGSFLWQEAGAHRWALLHMGSWPQALRGPRPGPLRHRQPFLSPQSCLISVSYASLPTSGTLHQGIRPSEDLLPHSPPGPRSPPGPAHSVRPKIQAFLPRRKNRDPINQPSRGNTQEGLLSVA